MPATATRPAPRPVGLAPPLVSVCVVNWNCAPLLRRCLESLFDQDQGVPYEVIVVDNASTDGAPEMVAADFPQVTLVRNRTNAGFSRGNNQAADLAVGRYLFFLNNDTELPPNSLRDFADYAAAHPEAGMIGPRLLGNDGVPQISYRTRPTLKALLHRVAFLRWTGAFRGSYYRYRRTGFRPDGIKQVEALMGAAVFLPREVFAATGRWDERYRFGGEDLDLSAQVNRVREVVYFPRVEILHHGRVSSRANVSFSAPNVAVGYVHYFRKSGVPPWKLLVYKLLVTADTPLQITGKSLQALTRLLRGRRAKAQKSWLAARGAMAFARLELGSFWRA